MLRRRLTSSDAEPNRPGALRPLLLAVALTVADIDPVIREVLELVERTYVEPSRIDAEAMLAGARAATARLAATPCSPAVDTRCGIRPTGPSLARRLGPQLTGLLDAGAPETGSPARELLRAAVLDGALGRLDRWSTASTGPRRYRQRSRFVGEVTGIGVRIGRRDGVIRVLAVLPGSGAEEAGLEVGDVLLRVGETSTADLAVSRVLRGLRGEPGSRVEVTLRRDRVRTLAVTRRRLATPTVQARRLPANVLVLRVTHLSRRTGPQFARAVAAARRGPRLAGLVLDLRGNTGGSMLAAIAVADTFVAEGPLGGARDRNGRPAPGLRAGVDATPEAWSCVPIAVLVDQRTGSSAELLAASLTWHDRALLVGARTYGKNVVGKLHEFPDHDLTVKLSTAYLHAADRRLPERGLAPDLAVLRGEAPCPPGAVARLRGDLRTTDVLALVAGVVREHGRSGRASTRDALRGDPSLACTRPGS